MRPICWRTREPKRWVSSDRAFRREPKWRRFAPSGRSRRFESGAAARRSGADLRKNVPPPAVDSAEEAVRGAQIVVTATNAKDPVLESRWITPGTLINAMGSNAATRRELPEELVCRADLVAVDSLEQAKIEAGDLILADSWANVVELQTVKRHWDPERDYDLQITWNWSGRRGCGSFCLRAGARLLLNALLIGIAPGADLKPAANPAQPFG